MLARLAPGFIVRWFARPYVAGDSLESALEVAAEGLERRRELTTLDLLGEDVTSAHQVRKNVTAYEEMIDALAGDPRFSDRAARPTVSLKPSAFTTGAPEDARAPIEGILERAHTRDVRVTIDMEDHQWTDFTLDLSLEHFARGRDVGTVLQTRLHRTEADLERIPEGMRVRLVIGIYQEPAAIAITDKSAMKDRMVDYARRLLARGAFVEFATHDEHYLRRFAAEVAVDAPGRTEAQLLLGVPRARVVAALQDGTWGGSLPVRRYVPYAVGWDDAMAYLRRRMEEAPGMVWLVLRNLLASRADRMTPRLPSGKP